MLTQFYNYILTGFLPPAFGVDSTEKKSQVPAPKPPRSLFNALPVAADVFQYQQPTLRAGGARNIGLVLCPTADFVISKTVIAGANETIHNRGHQKIIPFIKETLTHLTSGNLQDDASFADATMLSLLKVVGLEDEMDSFMLLKNGDAVPELMALIDSIAEEAPAFHEKFVQLWQGNAHRVTSAYTPEAEAVKTKLLALYLHTKEAILPALIHNILYPEEAEGLASLIPPIFIVLEVKIVHHAGIKDPITKMGYSAPENQYQLMPLIITASLTPAYDAKHTQLTETLMREPSTIVLQRLIDDKLQQGLADYFTPRAIIPNAEPFEA